MHGSNYGCRENGARERQQKFLADFSIQYFSFFYISKYLLQ